MTDSTFVLLSTLEVTCDNVYIFRPVIVIDDGIFRMYVNEDRDDVAFLTGSGSSK